MAAKHLLLYLQNIIWCIVLLRWCNDILVYLSIYPSIYTMYHILLKVWKNAFFNVSIKKQFFLLCVKKDGTKESNFLLKLWTRHQHFKMFPKLWINSIQELKSYPLFDKTFIILSTYYGKSVIQMHKNRLILLFFFQFLVYMIKGIFQQILNVMVLFVLCTCF